MAFRGGAFDIETLNFGTSGWTSAETLVNWFLLVQSFAPDVVVVHHAANDVAPRFRVPMSPDYRHYRRGFHPPRLGALRRWLLMHSELYGAIASRSGLPTLEETLNHPIVTHSKAPYGIEPVGIEYFRRNIESIVVSALAQDVVVVLATLPRRDEQPGEEGFSNWRAGIDQHNEVLRELAREHGCLLADLARLSADDPSLLEEHWLDLVHLTPEGNTWKARKIGRALTEGWEPLARLARSADGG